MATTSSLITVRFLGYLAERTGVASLEMPVCSLDNLISTLTLRYPFLSASTFLTAVNGEVQRKDTDLQSGDEVALLPPYAGG